jgi:hypothetical protein
MWHHPVSSDRLAKTAEEANECQKSAGFDYKTHILIGYSDEKMTVIGNWPHALQQAEVERMTWP